MIPDPPLPPPPVGNAAALDAAADAAAGALEAKAAAIATFSASLCCSCTPMKQTPSADAVPLQNCDNLRRFVLASCIRALVFLVALLFSDDGCRRATARGRCAVWVMPHVLLMLMLPSCSCWRHPKGRFLRLLLSSGRLEAAARIGAGRRSSEATTAWYRSWCSCRR